MDGENKGQEAQVSGLDPAHWDIVKDEQGNVTVSPKQAPDGCNGVDVVIGPGTYGPDGVVTTPAPARPFPELGHILCQVCKRPTNSEVQNDLVDTPLIFQFKGEPRAILCFDCYMHGIIHGAFASLPPDQRDGGGGGGAPSGNGKPGDGGIPASRYDAITTE